MDYINTIHPRVIADDGRPMYDGYIAGAAFVGAVPINQCERAPPTNDPRRRLQNAGVPVMRIMSQSDYVLGIASRRPDGDTRADRFRQYEMAGAVRCQLCPADMARRLRATASAGHRPRIARGPTLKR